MRIGGGNIWILPVNLSNRSGIYPPSQQTVAVGRKGVRKFSGLGVQLVEKGLSWLPLAYIIDYTVVDSLPSPPAKGHFFYQVRHTSGFGASLAHNERVPAGCR